MTSIAWKLEEDVSGGPLQLAGTGAIGLLGSPPTSLLFTNALGTGASAAILVGRTAIP